MALGYMSEAYVCGEQVLGTGSSLAPTFEYLQSDGVRGAGYLQAGLSVFAWNYKKWDGSIDWDVSGKDGALGKCKTWAVSNRNSQQMLRAKPGGYASIEVTGYNSGLQVSTSSGSLVSASASATGFGDAGSVSGGTPGSPQPIAGSTKWCGTDGVIPYWMTSASIDGGGGALCAIDWNISIENDLVPLLCCAGERGDFYEPGTIFLGPTEATIEVTLLGGMNITDFSKRDVSATVNCGEGTSFTVQGIVTGISGGIQTGDSICGLGLTIKSVACDKAAVS